MIARIDDPYADFTKHILSNGLEVHHAFWKRPWIGVIVTVHSGGREDPLHLRGLAHFTEHMVSKNILGWTREQAGEFFESVGGGVSFGATSYLSTQYNFHIPADIETFQTSLKMIGSMMFEARLKEKRERERAVILREYHQHHPFSELLDWDLSISRAIFRGHRLETWICPLGSPSTISAIGESDLQDFYDQHYVPANTTLVIVGGIPTDQVLDKLRQSPFGINKKGVRNPIPEPFTPPTLQEHGRTVKLSDHLNIPVNQARYGATWALPISFPKFALSIFTMMLQRLLSDEIRQKRALTYGISAKSERLHDIVRYSISTKVADDAISQIDTLVRSCIAQVPSRRDMFDRCLTASLKKCSMNDMSGVDLAEATARRLVEYQQMRTISDRFDDLQKVTFDQMAEAAALLAREQQYTFITLP